MGDFRKLWGQLVSSPLCRAFSGMTCGAPPCENIENTRASAGGGIEKSGYRIGERPSALHYAGQKPEKPRST